MNTYLSESKRNVVRTLGVAFFAVVMMMSLPVSARADWFVAPFAGATFKGDADHTSPTVGVSGGWMGGGWLGLEADLGWSPEFFKQDKFLIDRRVTSLVGNVMVSIPIGASDSLKPYVSGGLGLLQIHLEEAGGLSELDEEHKFAGDVGGGVMGFFNRNVGLRGDIRYFRSLRNTDTDDNAFGVDVSKFHFWRVSAGLVVRF